MTTFTDNFTRANDSTLGAGYTATPAGSMAISSNTAVGASGASRGNLRTNETYGNDQYVEFTVGSTASRYYTGYVRCAFTGAGSSLEGYSGTIGGSTGTYIARIVDGTGTDIFDQAAPSDHQTGDVIKVQVIGTTIKIFRNTTEIASVTDSTYTSGSPGIGSYSDSTIDDATFADIGGATQSNAPRAAYQYNLRRR